MTNPTDELVQKLSAFEEENKAIFMVKPYIREKLSIGVQSANLSQTCFDSLDRRIFLNIEKIKATTIAYGKSIDRICEAAIDDQLKLRHQRLKQDAIDICALMEKRLISWKLKGIDLIDTEKLTDEEKEMLKNTVPCPRCYEHNPILMQNTQKGCWSVVCASCGLLYDESRLPMKNISDAILLWNALTSMNTNNSR